MAQWGVRRIGTMAQDVALLNSLPYPPALPCPALQESQVNLRSYDNITLAVAALRRGDVKALVSDTLTMQPLLSSPPCNLATVNRGRQSMFYGFMYNAGFTLPGPNNSTISFGSLLIDALSRLADDGTISRLYTDYLAAPSLCAAGGDTGSASQIDAIDFAGASVSGEVHCTCGPYSPARRDGRPLRVRSHRAGVRVCLCAACACAVHLHHLHRAGVWHAGRGVVRRPPEGLAVGGLLEPVVRVVRRTCGTCQGGGGCRGYTGGCHCCGLGVGPGAGHRKAQRAARANRGRWQV